MTCRARGFNDELFGFLLNVSSPLLSGANALWFDVALTEDTPLLSFNPEARQSSAAPRSAAQRSAAQRHRHWPPESSEDTPGTGSARGAGAKQRPLQYVPSYHEVSSKGSCELCSRQVVSGTRLCVIRLS